MATVEEVIIRININSGDSRNQLNGLQNSFKDSLRSIGQSLTSIGQSMTQNLTMPILKGFGFAIKSSMEFEQQLDRTGAVSDATAGEMGKLKDQAIDLGIKTKYSALEVAQGQTEMVKAGRTLKQTMDEMADVLDLAAAGELEIARAAEISANMMNMFSKQGVTSAEVANLMAGAANQSAIDVNEFYTTMSYVGPVAASLGISLKDTSGAIAILGNNAIKGSKAGTGLRQFLMRLQPQSKAAGEAMAELGITTKDGGNKFYDATGKLKSLSEIIDILKTSTTGLTDKDKQQKLKDMFGLIASPTVLSLLNQETGALDEMNKRIAKISAADVAAEKMDNLAGSIELLTSSAETLGIQIGDILNPYIRKLALFANDIIGKFLTLGEGSQKLIIVIAGIVAAIGPLVLIVGTIITILTVLLSPIGLITTAIVALIALLGAGGLAGVLLAIPGIKMDGLKNAFQTFKDKAQEVYGYLKDIWKPAIQYLLTGDPTQLAKIDDANLRDSLKNLRTHIEEWSTKINKAFEDVEKGVKKINKKDIEDISDSIVNAVDKLMTAIDVIAKIFEYMKKVYDFFGKLNNNKGGESDVGSAFFSKPTQKLDLDAMMGTDEELQIKASAKASKTIKGFSDGLLSNAPQAQNSFKSVSNNVNSLDRSTDAYSKGSSTGTSFANSLANSNGIVSNSFGILGSNVNKLDRSGESYSKGNFTASNFANALNNANGNVSNSFGLLGSNVNKLDKSGESYNKGTSTGGNYASGLSSQHGNVGNTSRSLGDRVIDSLSGFSLFSSGKTIAQTLIDGLNAMTFPVKRAAGAIAQAIKDFFPSSPAKEGPLKSIPKWMPTMIGMMTDDMYAGIDKIKNAASNLALNISPEQYLTATAMPSASGNNVSVTMYNTITKEADADVVMNKMVNKLKRIGVVPYRA